MARMARLIRASLAVLGAVILAGGAFEVVNWISVQMLKHRLEPHYAITRELRKGMRREEVQELTAKHRAADLSIREWPEGDIAIWVQYSLRDTCYTTLQFRGGALVSTRTSGEDSPDDYCPEAPADIR